MKYIKHYNESDSLDDFKYLCNSYLASLKDSGLGVICGGFSNKDEFLLNIVGNFTWNMISDDVLPFLEIMNISYDLICIKGASKESQDSSITFDLNINYYNIDDLVNNRLTELYFSGLNFRFKLK